MNRWRRRWYDKGHLDGSRVAAAAYAEGHHDTLAVLRAEVKALRDYKRIEGDDLDVLVWRSDVLHLIDEATPQPPEAAGAPSEKPGGIR